MDCFNSTTRRTSGGLRPRALVVAFDGRRRPAGQTPEPNFLCEGADASSQAQQVGGCSAASKAEQIADDFAHEDMRLYLLRCVALGLKYREDGFSDMAALDVCTRQVDEQARLAFGRQDACVDRLRQIKGFAGIAQVDRRRDGMQLDVRRAELSIVIVAICTDASRHLARARNGFPGTLPVTFAGIDDG